MESKYLKMKQKTFLLPQDYENFKKFMKNNWTNKGISAFYNGFALSCIYQSIYRSLYFGIYDSLRLYNIPLKTYNFLICFPSAYVAAFFSSTLSLPLQKFALKIAE